MIELQKLIDWATAERERAAFMILDSKYPPMMVKDMPDIMQPVTALSLIIDGARLLLKHDESKQPQPPDFANTTFSEVPQVVSVENQESQQAVEGATPVVQQNEQTQEVYALQCLECGEKFKEEIDAQGHRCVLGINRAAAPAASLVS